MEMTKVVKKDELLTPDEMELMDKFATAIVTGTSRNIHNLVENFEFGIISQQAYRLAHNMVIRRREYWRRK